MAIHPESDVEAKVLAHVRALDTEAEVIEIDPALADTAEFCEAYGYRPEDSANCILVASRDDPPVVGACLVLATTRLDVNKAVRKLLEVRKLSFAPPDLVREVTGMEIGGVTPFALPADLPLYLDARIREVDRAIVGGGSRRLKVLLDPEGLGTLPNAQWVEGLAKPLPTPGDLPTADATDG